MQVMTDRSLTLAADSLTQMACEIAPGISELTISDHWAGLRPHAMDDLPVLGPVAGLDGLLVATAHYRNGILLAPLTAKIMTGFVTGDMADDRFEAFTADRFRLRSAGVA